MTTRKESRKRNEALAVEALREERLAWEACIRVSRASIEVSEALEENHRLKLEHTRLGSDSLRRAIDDLLPMLERTP